MRSRTKKASGPKRPRMYVDVHEETMQRQRTLDRATLELDVLKAQRDGAMKTLATIRQVLDRTKVNVREMYGRANQQMDTTGAALLGGRLLAVESLADLLQNVETAVNESTAQASNEAVLRVSSANGALQAIIANPKLVERTPATADCNGHA